MKRNRSTVREHVPVGRVSWLVIALVGALAAWLLFHYQASGIVTLVAALLAVSMGLLGFATLPPGRAYSFASRPRGRKAAGRVEARPHDEFNPPVSRAKLALYSALFGLLAGLAHWLGAPAETVGVLALCALLQALVMLLPDQIRRLLAWDMNLW